MTGNDERARRRGYDELTVGERRRSDPYTIDADDMIAFARAYDPQWFHADAQAAKASRFGEAIASGVYTAAIWRKLDHTINHDVDFICGVAWENARWPTAMRAGDVVRAASEIVDKRPSSSDPSRGIAIFDYRLINQHGEDVFSCRSINLVRRSAPD